MALYRCPAGLFILCRGDAVAQGAAFCGWDCSAGAGGRATAAVDGCGSVGGAGGTGLTCFGFFTPMHADSTLMLSITSAGPGAAADGGVE